MRLSKQLFGSNISKRILVGILLFSSLLTLFFTAYKLYQDYRGDRAFINRELASIQDYAKPILEQSLWDMNDKTIDTLIQSVSQLPHIACVEILDKEGSVQYNAGQKPKQGKPETQLELSYQETGRQQEWMGTLRLYADYSPVYAELRNRFFVTLYTQLFKTFLTSLFILGLVHYLVVRHIEQIVDFFKDSTDSTQQPAYKLALKRTPANDELQTLVDILNRYREETNQQHLAEITYNATHDYLTGTYNRYYFDKKLNELLKQDDSHTTEYVVGLMDLDSFKTINDLFGHAKGDEVLIHTAKTLRDHFGEDKLIARQGGDEFVFVVPMPLPQAQQQSIEMLKALESTAFYHEQHTFHISASIGLSVLSPEQDTVSTAISKADQGCYLIKNTGGGNVEIIESQAAGELLKSRLYDYKMTDIFRTSLNTDNLKLYAQAIVPLQKDSSLPQRIEVLSRLNHQGKLLMPDQFIPSLERGHNIHLLDRHIIRQVTQHIHKQSLQPKHININLSPNSFSDRETQHAALQLLRAAKSQGFQITFEITENALISHFERIREVSRLIREHGGSIAIDDFGKGHASYAYLERLDVDSIKIDASLVGRIADKPKILAIVSSIQSIANSIGATTIAEHVQSAEEKKLLQDIGIDYTQSFLDGQPYLLDT